VTAGSRPSDSKARCAGWKPIKYSGEADTFETIWQVRVHNQLGLNKRCKAFKDARK
jgi:hypothetical protein